MSWKNKLKRRTFPKEDNPHVRVTIDMEGTIMKSRHCRNNNNESEPDVEFVPTRSSTHTYVAVTSDDTTTRNANNNDTLSLVFAEECISYSSKCRMDDLPEEARGWTWSDPYYDMNDPSHHDIIAAFDIDRTLYDQSTFDMFKWLFLILLVLVILEILLICFAPNPYQDMFPDSAIYFGILVLAYGLFVLTIYCVEPPMLSEKKLRIQCMHIAIGTRGIYLDMVDSLGSANLMNRTRITYDEIKKCQAVSEYNPFHKNMNHKITINTTEDYALKTEDGKIIFGYVPKYTIEGIKKQQKFVDIVNAMLDRHSGTHPLAAAATTTDVESEIVYDGTNTDKLL